MNLTDRLDRCVKAGIDVGRAGFAKGLRDIKWYWALAEESNLTEATDPETIEAAHLTLDALIWQHLCDTATEDAWTGLYYGCNGDTLRAALNAALLAETGGE